MALLVGAGVLGAQAPRLSREQSREPRSRHPSALDRPAGAGIEREAYSYGRTGHRDPFLSLIVTEELHPLSRDLKLVAIAFDPAGRSSIAILRDSSTGVQYRLMHGDTVGRMRVVAIREKSVAVAIAGPGRSITQSLAFSARPSTMP